VYQRRRRAVVPGTRSFFARDLGLSRLSNRWRPSGGRQLSFESLERRMLLSIGPLAISEFMALNTKTLQDQDGAYPDWIEVCNPGTSTVNLGGWSLTDAASSLKMWQFPSQDLGAGQYLVVFASGKNLGVAGSELHTSFQLNAGGDYLALVEPDGKTISDSYSPGFPAQVSDVSYGWSQDFSTQGYFTSPSPGKANTSQPIPNVNQQVIVNEIMYHPGFGDPGYAGYVAEDTLKQWVELYNKGTSAVDLSNWQLSQGVKYSFPAGTTIPAGGYLVVAADPATFHATYPSVTNYVGGTTLVASPDTIKALVPTDASLGSTWTQTSFDDSLWSSGTSGVGYDQGTTYQGLIGLNVGTAMSGKNSSVYTRSTFTVSNPASHSTLHLRMKYDDGFVAYLNGVEVASANIPISPAWNSAATGEHLDDQAVLYADVDISASLSALISGTNVLAIQAMDAGKSDARMLVSPELVANCWNGKLGGGGDTVELDNSLGQAVNSISYTNDGDWALRRRDGGYPGQSTWWKGWEYTTGADAGGKSLELIDPHLPNQYGENWLASLPDGGTPGAANSVLAANTAPLIENVTHFPVVPSSIQTVTITAQLIDEKLSGLTATLYHHVDASAAIVSITRSGATATVTTLGNHGYANGDSIQITGADQSGYNGVFTISGITATTFTYTVSGNLTTPATGQMTAARPFVADMMYDDGTHGDALAGDGLFTAQLPAQADHTVVEFYVKSSDDAGHSRTWPAATDAAGTQGANALYQVDNAAAVYHSDQPLYRIITTAAEWNSWLNLMNSVTNGQYANSTMNASWITVDGTGTELHYVCGVRNRGAGTRAFHPHNFQVNIPSDHPWEHLTRIEFNTAYTESQTAGNAIFSAAGILNSYGTPVQIDVNGVNLSNSGSPQFGSYYRFTPYGSEWTATHTPDDSNGDIYKGVWYEDNVSLSNPANLAYRGTDPASYRQVYGTSGPVSSTGGYSKQTNSSADDWSDLVNLVTILNATYTSDDAYYQAISKIVNVDEWVRYLAVNALLDNAETTLATGAGDDYELICGAVDRRFQLSPHDLDSVLNEGDTHPSLSLSIFAAADGSSGSPSTPGISVMSTFLRNSKIAPKYYAALDQLATTLFSPAQLNPLLDRVLGSWVPASNIQNMKTFAVSRVAAVLAQIPSSLTAASPETVVSGFPHTTNTTTSLTGRFNVLTTASVKVNGVLLPISSLKTAAAAPYMRPWAGDWAASNIALNPGINRITIQAFDAGGNEVERTVIEVWRDKGSVTTIAGGTLAINTTWTAAGGPYSVTGSLTIPSGVTLTIQPGTTVYMASGANLTVNDGGILNAQGSDTQRISITRAPGSTSNWGGIVVNGSVGSPQTTISFTNIAYNGTTAIHSAPLAGVAGSTGGTVFLDHLTFGTNLYQYMSLDSSSFIVEDCEFPAPGAAFESDHGTGGIKSGGRGLFLRNFFGSTNSYNDVVDFTGGNRPNQPIVVFIDNVLVGESDDGWDLDGTDAWVQSNIFLHVHKNGSTPDSSSGVSGGSDSGNTSEVTIIDNIFYDVDQAAMAKQGNFFTLLNNTIVHQSHQGGIDSTGAVVGVADDGTTQAAGMYLEGNIISDAENLVRNQTTAQVTFNNNLMSLTWSGPGSGNTQGDPHFSYVPQLSETYFTDWQQAQILRKWFSLQPGSPAIRTGPNGADLGGANLVGVSVSGAPVGTTAQNTATLTVGINRTGYGIPTSGFPNGSGYTAYKWRLDGGAWSAETPIGTPIALTGLANGPHEVDVIGKNDAGFYQNDVALGSDAVITHTATWTVNTALAPHVRINEVLAENVTAVPHNPGPSVTYPDVVELYNDGQGTMNLSDMSLSNSPSSPRRFVFPAGTTLGQGQYLVLYGGTDTVTPANQLGFSFSQSGDSLYLYNSLANGGGLVDSITFGIQLPERSIGRLADGTWALTTPTFGAMNKALPTATSSKLKINEWLASESVTSANDFVEVYNGDTLPVNMGGMYLTDNPEDLPEEVYLDQQNPTTIAAPQAIPALSFIDGSPLVNGLATGGYAVFKADANPAQGADHLNFKLRPFQGLIGLFDAGLNKIDQVFYGPQTTDVSEGRNPLGTTTYSTETIPTPGIENTGTTYTTSGTSTTTSVIGSMTQSWHYLAQPTDPGLGTAWYQYSYATGEAWPSGAGLLYYESNTGVTPRSTQLPVNSATSMYSTYYFRTHFTFNGDPSKVTSFTLTTRVDDGALLYLNGVPFYNIRMPASGVTFSTYTLNGAQPPGGDATADEVWTIPATPALIAALRNGDNVLSSEVHQCNATSSDIVWGCTLGVTTGGALAVQRQVTLPANVTNLFNTLRVTEVIYNPQGDADLEFIELQNTGTTTLDLTGVRLGGGVSFTFPSMQLTGGQYVVVARNATKFTSFYGPGINLAGQYTGKLNNSGDTIVLQLPAPYDTNILRFSYGNTWVPASNGQGHSMVVRNAAAAAASWNDPSNWQAGGTLNGTPGRAEGLSDVVINEVLSHTDQPLFDSIELHNRSTSNTVDVSGWYLTDDSGILKYRIPNNTLLSPGQYKVFDAHDFAIADDAGVNDGAYFVEDSGATLHQSGNGWEQVSLRDPLTYAPYHITSNTVLEFEYKSPLADKLQAIGLDTNDTPDSSRGFKLAGSDSWGISVTPASTTADGWLHFVIDVGSSAPALLGGDMTRLFFANKDATGDAETFFRNVKIYEGPSGTPRIFDFSRYFGFNAHKGDEVWLIQADSSGNATRFDDHVSFGAAINGESFGRWPNGTGNLAPMHVRTLGGTNAATGNGPRVGPLVISEVMYNPDRNRTDVDNLKYVEIDNPTGVAVSMANSLLQDGIAFGFADSTVIDPYQSLLVVPFDPANSMLLSAFRTYYNLGTSTNIVGPYFGQLSTVGQQIQLTRPDALQPGSPAFYPQLLEDEVIYQNTWGGAGDGQSLQRSEATGWGDDPASWMHAAPTPGSVAASTHVTTWSGGDGQWSDVTWSGGLSAYPDYRADVVLNMAHVVTLSSPDQANSVTIRNGGQITAPTGSSLTVTADLTIGGSNTAGMLQVAQGASLNVGGLLTVGSVGALVIANNQTVVIGGLLVQGGSVSGGALLTGDFRVQAGTVSTNLSGSGALTKETAGTAILSGDNSYTGGTTVSSGTLWVTSSAGLPDGSDLTIGMNAGLLFGAVDVAPALAAEPLVSPALRLPVAAVTMTEDAVQATSVVATVPALSSKGILADTNATASAYTAAVRDEAIRMTTVTQSVRHPIWLDAARNSSASYTGSQDQSKRHAIEVLDSLLAEYERQ
jgi:autotransporter-associated beta strand protein